MHRAQEYFSLVLSTYHKRDNKSNFILSEYQNFEEAIDAFRKKNGHSAIPLLSEYVKMLISKIRETQLIMISMENAPK